jgi:tetratricopeptide (TPR) repeat protein
VALFVQSARRVEPFFDPDEHVTEIVRRVDGLPLAIELAAARTKLFSPSELLRRLDRRLPLLRDGARNVPARQRTLRDAIAWSYDLIGEDEQRLFRRLAVFAGGCTLEAAAAVCQVDGDGHSDVLDGVASLVDKNLLQCNEAPLGPRFRMLETIREYALERLETSSEMSGFLRRHADYHLRLAEEGEPNLRGSDQAVWLTRLEAEHDNLRAALGWACEGGDADMALRLSGSLAWFWFLRGHFNEGRRWLEAALLADQAVPTAARASVLWGTANLARYQGDFDRAAEMLDESLGIWRALGDEAATAKALGLLGRLARDRGDLDHGAALLEESLSRCRAFGDVWGTAWATGDLGRLERYRRHFDRATVLLEESLTLWPKVGDTWGAGRTMAILGDVLRDQGDAERHRRALLPPDPGRRAVFHCLRLRKRRRHSTSARGTSHPGTTKPAPAGNRLSSGYTYSVPDSTTFSTGSVVIGGNHESRPSKGGRPPTVSLSDRPPSM